LKIFVIFGTRPEAIKLAPLITALKAHPLFETKVVTTAQHRHLLDQVLGFFNIASDYDLDLMRDAQTLFDITSKVIYGLKSIFEKENPNLVLVHGDTTTTFAASLASYYFKIPVGHVEAGLRTHNIYSPFPEEINRKLTGSIARYHFAPTSWAKDNLLKENVPEENILVTGNTVIDALYQGLELIRSSKKKYLFEKYDGKRIILVTGHRRENFGEGFLNICKALMTIAVRFPDVLIVYPMHLNPNVREPVLRLLKDVDNILLIEPLEYDEFIFAMSRAHFIITDSGGVQEEAPALGKPVLVMRDTTERPEALEAGTVKLVGTDIEKIVFESEKLLTDVNHYERMSKAKNPYGDGKAVRRIIDFLEAKHSK
jgi:UDP-N-acetylglucosamine 2-epimerase (non-hydrolysing)